VFVSRRRLHTPPAVVVAFRLRGRELGEGLEQRHLARALPPHLDVVDVGGGEAERREVGLEQLAQLRRGDAALQPVEQHRHEASCGPECEYACRPCARGRLGKWVRWHAMGACSVGRISTLGMSVTVFHVLLDPARGRHAALWSWQQHRQQAARARSDARTGASKLYVDEMWPTLRARTR